MIHFTRLRISGFKSFVEKTELEIGTGLTGIVGPNGCGKSNLVEALRWAMGESSAKKMRGDGMEDVIFAGTEKRPARNFAEVSIMLDNRSRSAPSTYNAHEEIEVIRKITRDMGSSYKINGRPARARDVQLLFADSMSGANSPSIVSQGKVASIINAKPLERRMILEESAGISGLHARRHEAELRLKQAEQNLQRLEDMTGTMDSRLQSLKRQARQAMKYKNLNAEIRSLEQLISYLEWRTSVEKRVALESEFKTYDSDVADHMAAVAQLNKTYLTQTQDLPKLREAEARAAAALQTNKVTLQRMEEQEQAAQHALSDNKAQLVQIEADLAHSSTSLHEHETTLARMDEEQVKIQKDEQQNVDVIAARTAALETLEQSVSSLEQRYNTMMADTAAAQARKETFRQQIKDDTIRLERLEQRKKDQSQRLTQLRNTAAEAGGIEDIKAQLASVQLHLNTCEAHATSFAAEFVTLENTINQLREERRQKEISISKIKNEIKTLKEFIETFSEDGGTPVIEAIQADPGFETALSRALGDTLQASLDPDAPVYWQNFDRTDLPALPDGFRAMSNVVKAPKALANALSQIGLAETYEEGQAQFSTLKPGQALVSKDGAYWRWDGLCMKAEAADRQALFLKQKNTLRDLEASLPPEEETYETLKTSFETQQQNLQQLKDRQAENATRLRDNDKARQSLEKDLSAREAREESLKRELAALETTLRELQQDIETISAHKEAQTEQLKLLEDSAGTQREEALQELKEQLQQARQELQLEISTLDRAQQQQNSRKARLRAIADERITLQNRIIKGREHLKSLQERKTKTHEKLQELQDKPVDLSKDREALFSKISELEHARTLAADTLTAQESDSTQTAKALKTAENALSDAREHRARAQALVGAAQEQCAQAEQHIQEKFECTPSHLAQQVPDPDSITADRLDPSKEKRQSLLRERESLGPVNLQAEIEATELEKEMGGLLHEKNDLVAAIDELRGGIRELNNEARERLAAAFELVNGHFRGLFVRLFGGGQAHLSLVESDDPLLAGLEIFAQPPGKALQALSLMSGGEQTMASIALIFAMFLTNPAPICVLDEIDAPLDDANVDRVCDLLDEMAETTKTRFLVVTHHRLTMARMDRIYGVTMAEKGISQLVSLDMQQSFGFLEEAA